MLNSESPDDLVNKIRRHFVLGGHKAAAIGMVLQRAEIYLVSDMAPEQVERSFMRPYTSAQQAFDDALAKFGGKAEVITMPYGGSVLPRLVK